MEAGYAIGPIAFSKFLENPRAAANAADYVSALVVTGPSSPSVAGYLGTVTGQTIKVINRERIE